MEKHVPGEAYLEEEDLRPQAFRTLFDEGTETPLDRITETPTKMIIPLVRMALIRAASDPNREESLIDVFIRNLDSRMISRDRRGRLEGIQLMRAMGRGDEDIDELAL